MPHIDPKKTIEEQEAEEAREKAIIEGVEEDDGEDFDEDLDDDKDDEDYEAFSSRDKDAVIMFLSIIILLGVLGF